MNLSTMPLIAANGPAAVPSAPTPVPAARTGGTGAQLFPELDLSSLGRIGPTDARAMSKTLFARLATLEEGSHECSYVRNTLVELNLALVKFAAARFRTRSEPMEDIVQVGTIGLIKAIHRFDPDRGVEFPTFALPTILGEIKRFFRDTSWAVHVPRRLQELRLRLARARDDLAQKLDRDPTVAELATHLQLTAAEVSEGLLAANGYSVSSLDTWAPDDVGESPTLSRRLGYTDRALEGVDDLSSLKPLIGRLSDRERAILSLRFVQDMTQSQIGAQLGISQMHVSRLLAHSLEALRAGLLTAD